MKLLDPTIYVPHKIGADWARSAFQFTGLVDRRRVRREILRAFQRGGQTVKPAYIDACINASLNVQTLGVKVATKPMELPDDAQTVEDQ